MTTNKKEQTSQKRKRLLFHGLIRLWLRNSVLRTSNNRSHGRLISSHGITQPFPIFCLCLFFFCYCFFIHQNIYATFTLPPKPRCLPLHRICYLVLTDYQNVQFACKFAVMPRCLPTQPVTPRSMVMGLLPGFTCQPNSIMPLLPFTLGLGASPLTL